MNWFTIENTEYSTHITLPDGKLAVVSATTPDEREEVRNFLEHLEEHFGTDNTKDVDFNVVLAFIEAAQNNNLWDVAALSSAYEGYFETCEDYVREIADCPPNLGDAVFYVDWEQWGEDLLDDKYVLRNHKTWDLYVFDL